MAVLRVDLTGADRVSLAAEIADLLRAGELCVLPTETVYGLAVHPGNADAVARARELKGRLQEHVFTWHVAERTGFDLLARGDDPRLSRLLDRYWPGPLTVVAPAHDARRCGGPTVGVRQPAHAFTRAVIEAVGEPLWLTSVNRTGEAPLCDPLAIEREFGDALARIVDDGRSPLGVASTVVRCTGPELEVLREGILSAQEVLTAASSQVLFVCTGNTCRSPLAEVLARQLLASDLGTEAPRLLSRGICFRSAGLATLDGLPASEGSQLAAAEAGCDLGAHCSTALTPALVHRSSRIFCMTRAHLTAVLQRVPEAAQRTELLRPDGEDLVDPYGGDLADYRRARDAIAAALRERLPLLRSLLPPVAR